MQGSIIATRSTRALTTRLLLSYRVLAGYLAIRKSVMHTLEPVQYLGRVVLSLFGWRRTETWMTRLQEQHSGDFDSIQLISPFHGVRPSLRKKPSSDCELRCSISWFYGIETKSF